jgi:hypothetical protein
VMGGAHFFAGRFDQAAAELRLAVQEEPSFVPAYRFLAACYAQMGRVPPAVSTNDYRQKLCSIRKPIGLVTAVIRCQWWRPGTIRIAVIAGAPPPKISARPRLRFRSNHSAGRRANSSASDRARSAAQRAAYDAAECAADDRTRHRIRRGLRWGWRRRHSCNRRRRCHGYGRLDRHQIALFIVGDLGNNFRRTIQSVVVEIPIAISPPPIAAASHRHP